MEWRNRDWFWFTGILIGIMILIIASAYSKSGKLETNFNIIASAVSIALGIVAIFYAGKQDSDSRRANENFTTLLQNVISDVGAVKHQVDKISDTDIKQLKEETIEDVKLDEKKTNYSLEEVNKILSDAMDRFSSELKTKVETNNEINKILPGRLSIKNQHNTNIVENLLPQIYRKYGKDLSIVNIQKILKLDYNLNVSRDTLSKIIKK